MRFSSWVTHGIYKQAKMFCDTRISRVREYADSVQVVSCHRIRSFNEDDDICVFLVDRNEIPDTNIC